MKKLIYVFILFIVIISISACNKINIEEEEIVKTTSKNKALENKYKESLSDYDKELLSKYDKDLLSKYGLDKLKIHDMESSYIAFVTANGVVIDFMNAYINKDINTLKRLVPSIVEENSSIKAYDVTIEYPDFKLSYQINSFVYDSKSNELFIGIQLMNLKTSTCMLLNFTLKKRNSLNWDIVRYEPDV